MHVILFIDSLGGGGAQRQLVNLAIGLAQRKHTVHVFTYFDFDTHLHRLQAEGVNYHCFGKRGRWDLSPAFKLYKQVKTIKPEAVVAFMRTPAFYSELVKLALPRTRLIVSERCGVEEKGLTFRDYLPAIGHIAATHLTANSYDFLHKLTKNIAPLRKKSSVIYNGVDPEFMHVGANRIAAITETPVTQENHTSDTQKIATSRLCVVAARTTRQKGLIPLVKALQILATSSNQSFTIDWIGPFNEDDPLVQQAKSLLDRSGLNHQWRWKGKADDIKSLYKRYDALLLPSLYEGVANTMCEALCCGLPVVATDIADNRRILENGKTGILCKPDDPQSLANAILEFLKLSDVERQKMAKLSYQRANTLFSMTQFVDQWEQLCFNPQQTKSQHE